MPNKELLLQAIDEARSLVHPAHAGMTKEDIREIDAYYSALKNLESICIKKGLL